MIFLIIIPCPKCGQVSVLGVWRFGKMTNFAWHRAGRDPTEFQSALPRDSLLCLCTSLPPAADCLQAAFSCPQLSAAPGTPVF